MKDNGRLDSAFWAMRLGLGATAFLAGADKFMNLLTTWGMRKNQAGFRNDRAA